MVKLTNKDKPTHTKFFVAKLPAVVLDKKCKVPYLRKGSKCPNACMFPSVEDVANMDIQRSIVFATNNGR